MKLPVLVALLALLLAACSERTSPSTTSAPARAGTAIGPASASLYPLGLALRDQDDHAIALDVFRGSPTIISMFYGSCPAACPLLVAQVKEIEAALAPSERERTRVLLVSFDPEHDTPAALDAIARRHRVDRARWRFASGADDEVRQLGAALQISYRKLPAGGFAHDSVIGVLDGDGRIVARADDPRADIAPLVLAVKRALDDSALSLR